MTLKELKLFNLRRLVKDRKLSNDEFAAVLGRRKQQASSLLRGKTGIGAKTIKTLCQKWKIEENEFIRDASSSPSEKPPLSSMPQETLLLLQSIQNQIDDKTKAIDELKTVWEVIRRQQAMIDEITKGLMRTAETKNLKYLKIIDGGKK